MSQQLNIPKSEKELLLILDSFYAKAKEAIEKGSTPSFKNLLELINSDVVIVSSIHKIKSNKGSKTPGVDGKVIDDILTLRYEEVIALVRDRLNSYKPEHIRRVYIPKEQKKQLRPLSIPTIMDRIIQECVKMVIEPILEAQFFQHSYGFRPMRDAKQAVERIVFIQNRIGYNWVVEGDIKSFFDNVNHTLLIKQLWHMGIRDKRVLMIIKEMLMARVMDELSYNSSGIPQGGIISPLLANVYLHKLDEWITREWEEKKMRNGGKSRIAKFASLRNHSSITKPEFYIRYADDWVLFTNSKANAEKWKYKINKYLQTNLKLELSDEKTFITNMKKKPIQFLGFNIKTMPIGKKKKYVGYSMPNPVKLDLKVVKLRKEIRKMKYTTSKEWLITDIHTINSRIRGLINYYNCSPGVNLAFRKHKETLKYACFKALKKHGAKWKPANQCYNLKIIYPERTEQVPAIQYNGNWIGIISIGFATWEKKALKNQFETPYSKEGRELFKKNSKKLPLKTRVQELLEKSYFQHIMSNAKPQLYNFEFFMNRCYAYNRDKGKCRVCNEVLNPYAMHTHHIDNKLPIHEMNKVPNLASLCVQCHKLIHKTSIDKEDVHHFSKTVLMKLDKYRGYIHGIDMK